MYARFSGMKNRSNPVRTALEMFPFLDPKKGQNAPQFDHNQSGFLRVDLRPKCRLCLRRKGIALLLGVKRFAVPAQGRAGECRHRSGFGRIKRL